METLFYNISQVLGITIIHSLWQGLIIYLLLRILLLCLPSLSSVKKYNLSALALLGITIWFACTFYTEARAYDWNPITTVNTNAVVHFNLPDTYTTILPNIPEHSASIHDYKTILFNTFKSYLPYISVLYIIGLIINLSGLALAWNRIRIIKQNLVLAEKLQQQVVRFSQQLHIRKYIQVSFSQLVDVPCVIGYFKPILLLPVTLTTQLSAEEVEAILLHELAHIKSNDYLFNLLQQMISVLLFFNPFAWLINRIISRERENRCDDVVVQTTGNPLIYAHALLKLEENRQTPIKLALAATGKKHHLLTRIERIMQAKKPMVNTRHLVLAIIIFTGSMISISWLNPEIKNGKITINAKVKPLIKSLFGDTTRKTASAKTLAKNKVQTSKTGKAKISENDNKKLAALEAEIEKHSDAINNYYNSADFIKLQNDMNSKGEQINAFYNNSKLKALTDTMESKVKGLNQLNDNPEIQKLEEQVNSEGEHIHAYYNSAAFTKLQHDIANESKLLGKSNPGSEDAKKHIEAIKKMSEQIKVYADSPDMKAQVELIKKQGKQLSDYYKSPEYIQQRNAMRAFSDSIRKAYKDPKMKQQEAELRSLGAQMRAYTINPSILQEKEALKKAVADLHQYQQTAEYKQKAELQALEETSVIHNELTQPDKHYNYVLDGVKADEKTIRQLGHLVLGSVLNEHAEDATKIGYQFDNDDDVTFLFTKKGTELGNEVKEKLRKMNGLTSIPSGAFVYEPSPRPRPLKDSFTFSRTLKNNLVNVPSRTFTYKPSSKFGPTKDSLTFSRTLKNNLGSVPQKEFAFKQGNEISPIKDYHEFKKNEPVVLMSSRKAVTRNNKAYLSGNATIMSNGFTVKADSIEYDYDTNEGKAIGHVTMTEDHNTTTSGTATFSLANHRTPQKGVELTIPADPKETTPPDAGLPKNQSRNMQGYLLDTKNLVKNGNYKEALARDIWFHDHALEYDKAIAGVRLSFALADWKALADVYPPAMVALKSTRDSKTKQLIDNAGSPALFADVVALNRVLNDDAKSIDLFQLLAKDHPDAAQGYWRYIKEPLFAAKRYDLIHKYIGNVMQEFEAAVKMYGHSMIFYNDKRNTHKELFKATIDDIFVKDCLALIQYELAEKDITTAKKIQQQALLTVADDRLRKAIPN